MNDQGKTSAGNVIGWNEELRAWLESYSSNNHLLHL